MRCLLDLSDAVSHHPWLTGQRVAWTGEVAVVVIDVGCADNFAQQLLEEVRFLVSRTGRADAANCSGTMFGDDIPQACGNHIEGLVPCRFHKLTVAPDKWGAQAAAVDKIKVPATAVTQPTIVNIVVGT